MAGYMPKYQTTKSYEADIKTELKGAQGQDTLSALRNQQVLEKNEGFSFFDLLDIINPLQHIPVVNYAYRELTGDTIKPIGKIIGGAAFGGPLGATTALIDTMIANETGKNMTDHTLNFALKGETPKLASKQAYSNDHDMSRTLLSFSNLAESNRSYNA